MVRPSPENFNFNKLLKPLTSGKGKNQSKSAQQSDQQQLNTKKYNALKLLVKLLPISTNDSLKTISVNEFVKELVDLLKQQQSGTRDLRILASRALILLCDMFPSSIDAVVDFDGVNAFVNVLTEFDAIENKDEQQKYMQTLEKISPKCPNVGALQTLLLFFKSSIYSKVTYSFAINMCKEVTADDDIFVTSAVPLLSEYLKDGDAKVVNLASICLAEIVKASKSPSHILDDILSDYELIEQVATVISTSNSGGGQASLNTSACMGLVLLLTIFAKSSHLGFKTFSKISISVKDLLTGSGIFPAISRPEEQIFKIVNLADELLLPLPDSSRTEISARRKLLIEQPMLLKQFGLDILPGLIQICEDSVGGPVPRTCLSVIAKFVYLSSPDDIDSRLICQRISSFLAGVLARKDPIVLNYALWIAKLLIEKLPQIFSQIFVREGVMKAVSALIIPGCTAFPKPSSCEEESSKNSDFVVGSPPDPVEISTSGNQLSIHTIEALNRWRLELVDGSSTVVLRLKDLCSNLTGVCYQRTGSKGSHANEDTICTEILKYLSEGDGVSTFEFIDSGVVDALLNYLSCEVSSKENISDMSISRKEAMRRWRLFVTAALPSGLQYMEVPPMSILVEQLQKALSSLERFPLVLTHDDRLSCENVHLSSGLSSLDQKFNIRLCKAKGEESLTDYSSNVVQFHPLQKLADVEVFLWPRVQLDESGERLERPQASPKLIFFAGGKKLIPNMSIYEAIQRFIVDEIEIYWYNGESRLWGNTYSIAYQSANYLTETVSDETIGSTSLSKSEEVVSPVDSSEEQLSLVDSILSGELQCDLEKSNPVYKILALLRVLEGLNKQSVRKHAKAESSYEGKISSRNDIWVTDASVSGKEFINKTLNSKLEVQIKDVLALCSNILPSWCYQLTKSCPFLFPFETRRQYFYSTAFGNSRALNYLQQQQGVPEKSDGRFGRLVVRTFEVSRDCVLNSAEKIMKTDSNLQSVIEINFIGEDDVGLKSTLEFYRLLCHDLQKKVGRGMWRFNSSSNRSVMEADVKSSKGIASQAFDELIQAPLGLFPCCWLTDAVVLEGVAFEKVCKYFELLGRVLAKALQDRRLLDLPLSSAFYKLLLGQVLNLDDIFSFDAELGKKLLKLQDVKNLSCESGNSGHDYMLPDYPYKENVDINNLEMYVKHVVDTTVGEGISTQLQHLRDGFSKVFDISSLQIFSPRELEFMLCGRKLPEVETVGDLCLYNKESSNH